MLEYLSFVFPFFEDPYAPTITTWETLCSPEYNDYSSESGAHNPMCFFSSVSCSKNLFCPDLCFYHKHRIAIFIPVTCNCSSKIGLYGDSIGYFLACSYYGLPTTTPFCRENITTCCFYCANTGTVEYCCHQLYVGPCCRDQH